MAKFSQEIRDKYSEALLDAFRKMSELEDLYRTIFERELSHDCSPTAPLLEAIDAILERCVAYDKCDELIRAAVVMNPHNKKLQNLLAEIDQTRRDVLSVNRIDDVVNIIGFVNRKQELAKIFLVPGENVRNWVIDAPAGYGKSQLLAEVEKRYQEENWLTSRVEFPRQRNVVPENHQSFAVIDFVVKPMVIIFNGTIETLDLTQMEVVGMGIAAMILKAVRYNEAASSKKIQGISISVDNFENCPDPDVPGLLQFLSGIFTGLHNSGYFFSSGRLRIFISGRYARNKIKNAREQIGMADMPLAPFTFEVLKDTIQDFATSKKMIPGGLQKVPDIAAHLMHITGGHPGFTAKILSVLEKDEFTQGVMPLVNNANQYQLDFTQEFYAPLIQGSPQLKEYSLIDILVDLSPFRKYDRWFFLKELKKLGFLPPDLNEEEIEKGLLSTYLVDRQGGFLHDGIYRYLLEIRLRLLQPTRYAGLCEAGISIYKEQLESGSNLLQIHLWAIEYIYLKLIQNYHILHVKGGELIDITKRDVLWTIGALAHIKAKANLSEPDIESMREGFMTGITEDIELRFLYNFYVSLDSNFDARPFENLLSFVKQEFAKTL